MSATRTTHTGEIRKYRETLETLLGEIRVKIHLAGMGAKTSWRELEPQIRAAEESAKGVATEATHALLTETIKKLLVLRSKLRLSTTSSPA